MEQQTATELKSSKQEQPKAPPLKPKVYEIIQKNFALAGITRNLANRPFNGVILFGFIVIGSGISSTSAYIIYDAETFADYTQSIYVVSVAIFITSVLLILVLNVKELFDLFDSSGDLVNTSEY